MDFHALPSLVTARISEVSQFISNSLSRWPLHQLSQVLQCLGKPWHGTAPPLLHLVQLESNCDASWSKQYIAIPYNHTLLSFWEANCCREPLRQSGVSIIRDGQTHAAFPNLYSKCGNICERLTRIMYLHVSTIEASNGQRRIVWYLISYDFVALLRCFNQIVITWRNAHCIPRLPMNIFSVHSGKTGKVKFSLASQDVSVTLTLESSWSWNNG